MGQINEIFKGDWWQWFFSGIGNPLLNILFVMLIPGGWFWHSQKKRTGAKTKATGAKNKSDKAAAPSFIAILTPLLTFIIVLSYIQANPATEPKSLWEAIIVILVAIAAAAAVSVIVTKTYTAVKTWVIFLILIPVLSMMASVASAWYILGKPSFVDLVRPLISFQDKTEPSVPKMDFVYIQPGSFIMGSPKNEPERLEDEKQHPVTLTKGFYMQITELTQGQWKAVMGNNPSYFKECGDDCPVEMVSWNDVQEFIKKLNKIDKKYSYRLPTEAEWEYAARAGSKTAYCFGNDTADLGKYAWYMEDSTHPVAHKKPNKLGLYDMHGNVWEWCQDRYGDYPYTHVSDPTGPDSGFDRVYRGGSFFYPARICRSAIRDYWHQPDERGFNLGFRLVREAP